MNTEEKPSGIDQFRAELNAEREKVKELDRGFNQALRERDAAEAIGTRLAEAVGEHFRVEVGEYSNMNDPREMAIAILLGEYQTDSDADRELAAEREKVAQLEATVERYKAQQIGLQNINILNQATMGNELAAAQATIANMREALEALLKCKHGEFCDGYREAERKALSALSAPTNLDALHEDRARECERLAGKAQENWLEKQLYMEAAAHRAKKQATKEEGK